MEYSTPVIAVVVFIIIVFLLNNSKSNTKAKLPPGKKPWPIIGNIYHLGRVPPLSFIKFSQIYGPVMSVKRGTLTTIVISSAQAAQEIFTTHDLTFSSRKVPDARTIGNHHHFSLIWLSYSPKWRNLRKISKLLLFTNQKLNMSGVIRETQVKKLLEYVKECCERGVALDIGLHAFTAFLNSMSNTLVSLDFSSHDSSYAAELRNNIRNWIKEGAKPNISDYYPFLRRFDLLGVRKSNEIQKEKMYGLFERVISERLNGLTPDQDDVLNHLLKLVKENELNFDDMKHTLQDLFIAGLDGVSNTLEWSITELLRNPDKMAKAQEEIDQVIGKNNGSISVQESDITKLPYIQAVVKETLRLHSPNPLLIPRTPDKDVEVCGYMVPKGAQVLINARSIGRDPRVWLDPDSFSPERFMMEDSSENDGVKGGGQGGRDFKYIPFGGGRRMCPGMPMAYRMVHLMLANLLHSFDWKLADGLSPEDIDIEESIVVILQKANPLMVFPLARWSKN